MVRLVLLFQDPKSSKVAGKFDLARQPMGDGKIHSGWAGHHGFSITKASKEKAMAAALIKHLTSVEGNDWKSKLGILVSRQSVWDKIIKDAATSTDPSIRSGWSWPFCKRRKTSRPRR